MYEDARCVIDYNTVFTNFSMPEFEDDGVPKVPLSKEMFDPYQSLKSEYRLAIGDILEITVFGEKEMHVEKTQVAPDGKIYYSILNGVEAEGKTIPEVNQDIASRLGDLFVDPKVTMVPKSLTDYSYRILGRVNMPGIYPLVKPVRLREAIAEAGDLISDTDKNLPRYGDEEMPYQDLCASFIVRDNQRLSVDFKSLILEGDEAQNVYLQPGDYVYIAPAEKREVFVLGSLTAPQRLPFTPGLTLIGALSSVGGWPTPGAYSPNLKKVLVIRGSLCCPCVAEVDLEKIFLGKARDLYLMPGDIVYAQHKHMRLGRELVRIAVYSFLLTFVGDTARYYAEEHWFD